MRIGGMDKFCCRCKEDFPLGKEPTTWKMGELRELKKAPIKIRNQLSEWIDSELHGKGCLCGNCYFDLTD